MHSAHAILTSTSLIVGLAVGDGSTALAQSCGSGNFCARYFDNRSLEGQYVEIREQHFPIDIDWSRQHPLTKQVCVENCGQAKSSGPSPVVKSMHYGVGNDNFSIDFRGSFNFAGGVYEFVAGSDDGLRLYLDGNLIINRWNDRSYTEDRISRHVSPGNHEVRLLYYEHGSDARVRLYWYQI